MELANWMQASYSPIGGLGDVVRTVFPDVFEGNGGSSMRLPVYTVDAATLERCKSDTPQRVVVAAPSDPAKVKGVPYAPLRPPARRGADP